MNQTKKIELTFGIPIYNCELYISELLNCFKKSKDLVYEILIVNDGSTDNSVNICKKFNNLNIRIINQKNFGVSSARNTIIKNAKGNWLTFVDSDDLIYFDEYISAFNEFKKTECDYLINLPNYKKTDKEDLSLLIETEIINSPCMKIYSVNKLKQQNVFFKENISLGEDLIFNLEYSKICNNIYFYYQKMYTYRSVNENSLTYKYRNNKFEELMLVNEYCKSLFNNIKIYKSLEYIRIKNCFSCLKSEIYNDKKDNKEIINYIIYMRKYQSIKLINFNNLKAMFLYYSWYLLPASLLFSICKKVYMHYKECKKSFRGVL